MKHLKDKLIIAFLLLYSIQLISQIPNGSWRDHLSYLKGKQVAITPDKVYYIAEKSGMLSIIKNSDETTEYSTVTGLSDIDISTIFYSEEKDMLIICYSSGNIDLMTKKKDPINIPDILNKNIISSKQINDVESFGDYVYLACDFGIVVLDLKKIEIKESYFFGESGSNIKVNDIAISGDTIYAATISGIYRAKLNDKNLLDYSNWDHLSDVPANATEYKLIESFAGRVFAVYHSSSTKQDQIIQLQNGIWSNFSNTIDTVINDIDTRHNCMSITGRNHTAFLNESFMVEKTFDFSNCYHSQRDDDGTYYFASFQSGFTRIDKAGNESDFRVESPRFNTVGQVFAYKDQVWVATGGPFNPWYEGGAYNFSNSRWISLNAGWYDGLNGLGNFYKISFLPSDPNHIFASAYLFGLYDIKDHQVINSYTYDNSEVFRSVLDPGVNVRIMGQDFDSKEDLWFVCDITVQPLFVLRKNGNLEHLDINLSVFKSGTKYRDLIVTESGQIWILTRNNGIIVLKENEDGTFLQRVFSIKNQQEELIGWAYCLEEDKDGIVWVGTNKGPLTYSSDDNIFNLPDVNGTQISIPRNDGTSYADYLLDYVTISDIAIDGGNRKWIATENSGVYLVSSDGKKTYHHFTKENSPLFSDNIIGLDVQQNTGEVFISTNRGLLSYMGTSTEGLSDYTDVYVYPNPIRPEYDGDITITGLIENSNVKITDISGNLVFETTSEGGKAIWNGKNFNGDRAHTGVYLVFLTDSLGLKTYITKLLFIH